MAWNEGPIAVTGGVPVTVPAPQGAATIANRVTIYNASQMILQLSAPAPVPWIQPNQQVTIPSDGSTPVFIEPQGVVSQTGQVFLTWLGTYEPDIPYEGSSPTNVNNTPTEILVASGVGLAFNVVGQATAGPFTVPAGTRTLILYSQVGTPTLHGLNGNTATQTIGGNVSGQNTSNSEVLPSTGFGIAANLNPLAAPIYAAVDTTFSVVWNLSSLPAGGANVTYWVVATPDPMFQGQTNNPVVVQAQENPDNYGNVVVSSSTGAQTLVPSPPTGFYWKVQNFSWNNSNAAAATSLQLVGLTSGGDIAFILVPELGPTIPVSYPPFEFNLTEGLSVTSNSATAIRLLCSYRPVPIGAYS